MDAEDWLNSSLTLCELRVVPDCEMNTANGKEPKEVVCEEQSCSPAPYNQGSIFWVLDLYAHTLLDKALKRDLACSQGSTDLHRARESLAVAAATAVGDFAQALANDIIRSATNRSAGNMEEKDSVSPTCCGVGGHASASHCFFDPNANVLWGDDQECKVGGDYANERSLAECVASVIIRAALREVTKQGGPLEPTVLGSASDDGPPGLQNGQHFTGQTGCHRVQRCRPPCDEGALSEHGDMQEGAFDDDMDVYLDGESAFTPASSRTCGAPSGTSRVAHGSLLSQASLASNQSLDYPDAPPSTPLMPGVTQSRASFCRKLKGGLAKEFLPAPPPPTPNKNQSASHQQLRGREEIAEDAAKFVERLMRSLSLECSDGADVADANGRLSRKQSWEGCSALSSYAQQLSLDIMKYATTSGDGEDSVDRLIWLLSLECAEDTLVEIMESNGRPLHKTPGDLAQDDFADQLATDIIACATRSYVLLSRRRRTRKAVEEGLLAFAEQCVGEILEDSYREMIDGERSKVNPLGRLDPQGARSERGFTSSNTGVEESDSSQLHEPTPTPTQGVHSPRKAGSQDDPEMRRLRELADELLVAVFAQALTELRSPALHPGAGSVSPVGPPDQTLGSSQGRISPEPAKRPPPPQASPGLHSPGNSGQAARHETPRADDAARRAVVDCYAEHLAMEVIDVSAKLASKYRRGDEKTRRLCCDRNGSCYREEEEEEGGDTTQRCRGLVARAELGPHMCRTTRELKGALLWAAASQQGIRTLTLVIPDTQLQSQFRSVARNTHLAGLTVGDLVTSLLQHCAHLSEAASRGSSSCEVHPLTYLQELTGVSL